VIGTQHELWQYEYVKDAYTDQMGVKHEANVVRRKVIVTVVRTLELQSSYTADVYKDGIWKATDETGMEYTQWFDELSMGGRQSWSDNSGGAWTVAQNRGWFTPFMNPDGTKAVPVKLPHPPCALDYQI
jgi:hypothetical protein